MGDQNHPVWPQSISHQCLLSVPAPHHPSTCTPPTAEPCPLLLLPPISSVLSFLFTVLCIWDSLPCQVKSCPSLKALILNEACPTHTKSPHSCALVEVLPLYYTAVSHHAHHHNKLLDSRGYILICLLLMPGTVHTP